MSINFVFMNTELTLENVEISERDFEIGQNDGFDKYDLYFKYSDQGDNTKTSLSFSFKRVGLSALQRIVQGDFDEIILGDSDGSRYGMSWTLAIEQNKCLFESESTFGGSSLALEFSQHLLVDALRNKIEVLQDLPLQTNVKSANK